MREQLLLLLENFKTPELYLILEHNVGGSYSWKRFKQPAKRQNFKTSSRYINEKTVVNIYLAYLAQMCQSKVYTIDRRLVTQNARRVLCPKAFLDYIKNPEHYTLAEIIKTVKVVHLEPGAWQNRGQVLKWQAGLAVSRKRGKQFEPILLQTVEHHYNASLPPAYLEADQLPAYSNEVQPPAIEK